MELNEAFARYMETLPPAVVKNTKIVTPGTAGQSFMLHISTNPNIRKFIPQIGDRQHHLEDRTVPRICVAPHILGCVIGYNRIGHDFVQKADGKSDANGAGWVGGWTIYAPDFEFCFWPGKVMVPDRHISDEHWLVTYSPETIEYIPRKAGKFFMRSLRAVARSGDWPSEEIELMAEVMEPTGIWFSKSLFLKQGYHRIVGPNHWMLDNWKDTEGFTVTEITKDEYQTAKKLSAALLNYKETPAMANW